MNTNLFWSRVNKTDTCWLWTGPQSPDGYGKQGGRSAHRVVFELLVGPVPEGLELDHLCRVRHCVNPDHLEPVTHRENLRRALNGFAANNRIKTHCDHGHEFTVANTYINPQGWRECRACVRAKVKRYKERKKAAA